MAINDNDRPAGGMALPVPDAHGLAALLLVESLIHGLIENSTLSVHASIEIAERALSVQFEQAEAAGSAAAAMWQSHRLLASIAASLSVDDDNPPTPV